ncbi:16S rRNA (cytidine(1402)-2'-O)-methyltransferase [Prochlorococcus marinus]|jgi:16S rRNA (cytidine1402-2'-O)-methyltransferase|uniref:Ribosomal RNA small subunit methyltransferase I n=1 Tax=Prochlorococcus marinus (strain MIT 9301) TaxID=167546 RepID=A3PE42_PROM0|nr:16S rRNA (cytidine(1402)-2'-O)-methyltransferase [Prochlorococcus marinus]ABO18017.1 putative tetrapyrrole methylase family protein [Prochlorococcus marinus str. MIT 9301]
MNSKLLSSHNIQEPESSVLYIVGTPIGNLNDLSPRALNILKKVELIACEDTRQTKKILQKFDFKNNLISFNKHNYLSKIPKIINYLNASKSIALVSDAGMPLVCDPGEELVKDAKSKNIKIVCIPGPCAAISALVTSGMSSSKFTFEGFLPKKKSEREKILFEISKNEKTTIIFEAPHRLRKLLFELKVFCGGQREIQVSRELTKKFEEHIGDNIDKVIDFFDGREVIGEITIVIKGCNKKIKNIEFNQLELKKELHELVKAGLSLSSASKYLARKKNLTKKIVYNSY